MTNERHEKALEAACRAMHELQGTGDADAPRFSPYQNSWDEPDTVRWTQWKESCEEVITAYLASLDAVIVPKEPADEIVSAFMAAKFEDGDDPTLIKSIYRRIVSSAPNHFTNGE